MPEIANTLIADAEIKEIIARSMSKIKDETATRVIEHVSQSLTYSINDIVYKEIEKQLKLDIQALIEVHKEEILKAIPEAFKSFYTLLKKAIEDKIKVNMAQSWNMQKIFEGLFR